MFERDKDELRELGIPLVTEDIDPLHEDEPGYRIDQREYALPDIAFEPDELAVLGLASRTWAQASLAGPAAQALRKLRAAGRRARRRRPHRHRAAAAHHRAGVRRGQGRRAAPGAAALLLPAPRGGRGRRAARAAVVARVVARPLVPQRLRRRPRRAARLPPLAHRRRRAHRRPARVVRGARRPRARADGRSGSPRRRPSRALRCSGCAGAPATACAAGPAPSARSTSTWDLVDLDHHDLEDFAEELAGYGADVVVEQPPELVDAVVRRLRGALVGARGRGSLMAGFTQETATARLARLLTMVPWLVNRQGIDVQQAADDLGVSVDQLEADLNLLFLCGYGQMPDELIEADWEERQGLRRQRRHDRPPAAPRRRRGRDPHGRAARAARGARPGRPRRRRPGPGQARGRRRRRGRAGQPGAGRARRRRVRRAAGPGPAGDRRPPPRAPALPRARPRRVHRARRRPDAGRRARRPLVPRGLVPPRRGHPDVPDGPGRGAHRARRRRDPAGRGPGARPLGGHLPAQRPTTCVVTLRLLPGATWIADYYPVESAEDVPAGRRRWPPRADAHGGHRLAAPARLAPGRPRRGRSTRPRSSPRWPRGAAAALTAYPATAATARADAVLPWWGWVLLWAVLLVVGGALWLGCRWRGGSGGAPRRLGREVPRASALMVEALEARVDELRDVDPPPTAVTQPPHRLRAGVSGAAGRDEVAARRVRRAERLPPWARVD